jgi:hypothetical protein
VEFLVIHSLTLVEVPYLFLELKSESLSMLAAIRLSRLLLRLLGELIRDEFAQNILVEVELFRGRLLA